MCWPEPKPAEAREEEMIRDFIALNCESVKFGVTTSKELTHYRATHDILRPKDLTKKDSLTPPNYDIVHGIVNREPTPMPELIAHKYQKDWIDSHRQNTIEMDEEETRGVDTFRSEECRKLAFKAYEVEKPVRMGMLSHGVYRTGQVV